jgi:uncharacterized phiE125 gp8 family phage protein
MPLIQTQVPAIEPVSLADVYLQAEIIDNAHDSMLLMLISAARQYVESYTGRSLITQKWRLILDSFPGLQSGGYVEYGQAYSMPANAILLERGNVQSVDSITYVAMDGTTQTAPSSGYVSDLSGCPARVAPKFGQIWPIPIPQIGAVTVDYTAGYGPAATDVPEGIRNWILMRVATLFANRETVAILNRGKVEALPFVDTMLDPFSVVLA